MRPDQMLKKAEQCKRMAAKAASPVIAQTLLELAYQWRDMAAQSERFEQFLAHETDRNPITPLFRGKAGT
jgi:hypothetical protein